MSERSASGRATVFRGGTIWRGTHAADADALLVVDGLVAAVGSGEVDHHPSSAHATVIDLDHGFLMPSFAESHAHPILGGLEADGPDIRPCTSVDEILRAVRSYADEHPERTWIVGASYEGTLARDGLFDARWLDEAVADRPVVLRAWDYHTLWCNSRALELAGITTETPEPEGGSIPRREDGSPLGTLREWGALELMYAVCPVASSEDRIRALQRGTDYFRKHGVTWVQDAMVEPIDVEAYLDAARRDLLRIRFNLAFYADPQTFDDQVAGFVRARDEIDAIGNDHLTANTVKFFADGVVESETGALLEPYCSIHHHGELNWTSGALADAFTKVDAAGFQLHVHATGDAAARQVLDAIETMVDANGPRDRRPVLAHAQLVDESDMSRVGRLGVVISMQPYWSQLDDAMRLLFMPRLGPERSREQFRTASFLDGGVTVAFGSDWPCSPGDPLTCMSVAVTRQTLEGVPAGGWVPDERVGIAEALASYTDAVAYQAYADQRQAPWGRVDHGATADLVWLQHDPRQLGPDHLRENSVRMTLVRGRVVHAVDHQSAEVMGDLAVSGAPPSDP